MDGARSEIDIDRLGVPLCGGVGPAGKTTSFGGEMIFDVSTRDITASIPIFCGKTGTCGGIGGIMAPPVGING